MARLLVIDDIENNRILLSRRFKSRGHEILMAENAEQGIALAREQKPDAIFMDVGLPGMDGWEATRVLKADPETKSIIVIALTAYAASTDREKALAAGADEFETKPFDFATLLQKLEALLAKRAANTGSEKKES